MTIGVEDKLVDIISTALDDLRKVTWKNGNSTTFTVTSAHDVKVHSQAYEILSALSDIKQHVRGMWKHADLTGKDPHELIDEIYEYIGDTCSGISGDLL